MSPTHTFTANFRAARNATRLASSDKKIRAFCEVPIELAARIVLVGLTALFWGPIFTGLGKAATMFAFATILVGGHSIFKTAVEFLCRARITRQLSTAMAMTAALCILGAKTALLILLFALFEQVLRVLQARLESQLTKQLTGSSSREIPKAALDTQYRKLPVHETTEWLANYLLYASFIVALFSVWLTHTWATAVPVLVIAGSLWIGSGAQLMVLSGLAKVARMGFLVNQAGVFEYLARVDTVALNWTRVLQATNGQIIYLHAPSGVCFDHFLTVAACADRFLEKPIAWAVQNFAKQLRSPTIVPTEIFHHPGQGITFWVSGKPTVIGTRPFLESYGMQLPNTVATANISDEVWFAQGGVILGTLTVFSSPGILEAESGGTLARFGVETLLLTADKQLCAEELGRRLGVDKVEAELFSDDVECKVSALLREGRRVLVVDTFTGASAPVISITPLSQGLSCPDSKKAEAFTTFEGGLKNAVQLLRIVRDTCRIIDTGLICGAVISSVAIGLAMAGVIQAVPAAIIALVTNLVLYLAVWGTYHVRRPARNERPA